MKIEEDLQNLYKLKTEAVARCLVPLDELGKGRMRRIMQKYVAAVEPNFIPWVAAGVISARSVQGRYAASENLLEEIQGDHQEMLRDFAMDADCEPEAKHYRIVRLAVQNIRNLVGQMDGLQNIAFLAHLENTSAAFIPYLAQIAKRLGSKNFTYTDAHGIADVEHAKQFLWALGHERKCGYERPHDNIRHATALGQGFLREILELRVRHPSCSNDEERSDGF